MAPTPGPESRTLLASPIADRVAGPIMQMQRMEALTKAVGALRQGIQLIARMAVDVNPRGARELEKMAAQLLTLFPTPGRPPQSAGAVEQLTQSLPQGRGGPIGQMPPPAVSPGMPLSGSAMMP